MARDKTELTDLTDKSLDEQIRLALHRASLEGRLDDHEIIADGATVEGDGDHFAIYRKHVRIARSRLDAGDRSGAMQAVLRADTVLSEIVFQNDPDRLRGVKTKRGASLGGESTARETAQKTKAVIQEMERLQRANPERPLTWLANVAFRNGKGRSAGANRAAWYRHAQK